MVGLPIPTYRPSNLITGSWLITISCSKHTSKSYPAPAFKKMYGLMFENLCFMISCCDWNFWNNLPNQERPKIAGCKIPPICKLHFLFTGALHLTPHHLNCCQWLQDMESTSTSSKDIFPTTGGSSNGVRPWMEGVPRLPVKGRSNDHHGLINHVSIRPGMIHPNQVVTTLRFWEATRVTFLPPNLLSSQLWLIGDPKKPNRWAAKPWFYHDSKK